MPINRSYMKRKSTTAPSEALPVGGVISSTAGQRAIEPVMIGEELLQTGLSNVAPQPQVDEVAAADYSNRQKPNIDMVDTTTTSKGAMSHQIGPFYIQTTDAGQLEVRPYTGEPVSTTHKSTWFHYELDLGGQTLHCLFILGAESETTPSSPTVETQELAPIASQTEPSTVQLSSENEPS